MATPRDITAGIFRAYDIRGIVGRGLDHDSVQAIGQAIGSEVLDLGEDCLLVARDARLSSPQLGAALIEGVRASGCNVLDLGVVPTPLLYFATHALPQNCGAMLTGSHNPRDYNGIKVVLRRKALVAERVTRLRDRIVQGDLHCGAGTLQQHDIVPDYIARICSDIRYQRPFRVLIDAGNGVTGTVAPQLFRALGCHVDTLFCEPDGNFPNHHPDPTRPENLQQLQAALQPGVHDLGIAFDGDGDRVILLTPEGRIIDADHMLLAFAMDILDDEPGAAIVFDVKSSHHLARQIAARGGKPLMCKSGHSFVKQCVLESGAALGGEYSAHIFFRHRWYGFDDGLYVAARFLELMDRRRSTADALLAGMPPSYSTPELFLPVSEDEKFALMELLVQQLQLPGAQLNHLDGIRADFEQGWGLIRASNTTPNLVLRFEADTPAALQQIQQQFRSALTRLLPRHPLPF
jgi:phosphomannomutase/phosphoglucomutase